MSPRRTLIVAAIVVSGCAAKHHAPPLAVPEVETGTARMRASAAHSLGSEQPMAAAVTNGLSDSIRVDPRQAFAIGASGDRIAPLPPGEAVRFAKAHGLPGSLGGAGAALGVALGAITGAVGGGGEPPANVGYTECGLPSGNLAPGLSSTGYLYYPDGSYETVDLPLTENPSGRVLPERVSVSPAE